MLVSIINESAEEPERHPFPCPSLGIGIRSLVIRAELAGECRFKVISCDCLVQAAQSLPVKDKCPFSNRRGVDPDCGDIFGREACHGWVLNSCIPVVVPVLLGKCFMHIPLPGDMVLRGEKEPWAVAVLGDILPVSIPCNDRIAQVGIDMRIGIDTIIRERGLPAICRNEGDLGARLHSSDEIAEIADPGPLDRIIDLGRVHALCLCGIPEIGRIEGDTLVHVMRDPITDNREVCFHPDVVNRGFIDDGDAVRIILDDVNLGNFCGFLELGQFDFFNIADTVMNRGETCTHQAEGIRRMRSIGGKRQAVHPVGNDKPVRGPDLLAGELLAVSVPGSHDDCIAGICENVIESVRAVRNPVVDPSHEPPERYALVDIPVPIGIGG